MTKRDFHDSAAIQRLRDAIYATEEFRSHLPNEEPDWATILAPLKLAPEATRELTAYLRRLRLRPRRRNFQCESRPAWSHPPTVVA